MRKHLLLAGLAVSSFMAVTSCNKDCDESPKPDSPDTFNPTPYNFSVPGWVMQELGPMPSPADNPTTQEGVLLGRKLFYDKQLSDNNTISCASCHAPESSFSDARRFSEGTNGAKGDRNSMAVVNLAWAKKMFWDGRRNTLEEQAHDPVTNPVEMRNAWPVVVQRLQSDPEYSALFYKAFGTKTIDSLLVTKALAQFERTLVSFNSRFDQFHYEGRTTALNASEKRGYVLFFNKAGCSLCHKGALLTDESFRNIGLDDVHTDKGLGAVTLNAAQEGKFKVPTLRNVALTAPYMHDGRFAALETVIDHYDHGVHHNSPNLEEENIYGDRRGLRLDSLEKADLLNFLHTLTDSSFISNPAFQDPNLQ
ncbi:MAG: cytochrome-c peroxidase [Hymenobacteraceae bacterium]|nr:cytochrome-c peroxidase [Hymenobacteraceae bacterium]MDX5397470.1 cytochrome-c peroxidase [Hymenobacteraceae bacterium]MDX5513546.1 cytochrome-c peroxidase [Hymenobacteraceae bacterium]